MGTLQDYAEVPAGQAFPGSVADTQPAGRKKPAWRQTGNIRFLARGARNFIVHLEHVPSPAVCSQYFFPIRLTDPRLLTGFLAWQIKQAPAQAYLQRNTEGSDQFSIRCGMLEKLRSNRARKVGGIVAQLLAA